MPRTVTMEMPGNPDPGTNPYLAEHGLANHSVDRWTRRSDLVVRYSWGIPNDAARRVIHENSPHGVVEIGAGGGYWAGFLRAGGVDVVAYDPAPKPGKWHAKNWSEVLYGDHTSVLGHPGRTLLLVWPSYDEAWTHEVLDLYGGDTVIYVGEGDGGCTGTDRMHDLLGLGSSCWEHDGACSCRAPALFTPGEEVAIPQWEGMHDYLHVCRRI